ncbi:MAG: DUF1232 domain-containing protein [Anaerolineae bacterium]|nr:DUF1232 domain-containing protein [Anaerolineae bacterium]
MTKQKKRLSRDPDLLIKLWQQLSLTWRLIIDGRVSATLKFIPALMVAYILSPVDLIPDVFLPFGVLDDIGALLLGLQLFIRSAPPDIVAEHRARMRGRSSQEADVIEGQYTVQGERDQGES